MSFLKFLTDMKPYISPANVGKRAAAALYNKTNPLQSSTVEQASIKLANMIKLLEPSTTAGKIPTAGSGGLKDSPLVYPSDLFSPVDTKPASPFIVFIERDGFVYLESYQDTNFDQIDIFSPCATGGDLNQEFLDFSKIKKVKCVLGAANNQLADNDIEQKLFNEGIIYCPDYCVNAGGVIILALRSSIKEDMEYDEPEANKKLTGIKDQLKNILLLSQNKNQLSTVSSNELAEQGFQ